MTAVSAHACYAFKTFHDGGIKWLNNNNLTGVKGNIKTEPQRICDDSTQVGFSSAWVMIQDYSSGLKYMQSGYATIADGTHGAGAYPYAEWNDGSGYTRKLLNTSLSYHSIYTYSVLRVYDSPSYRWDMRYSKTDGTSLTTILVVYNSNVPFDKDTPFFSGETHNLDTEMPGSSGAHATFRSLQMQVNGSWSNVGVNSYVTDSTYYKQSLTSGNNYFDIWDSR